MKEYTTKAFVKSWTTDKVLCEMIHPHHLLEFKNDNLFANMKLFKGKNIWFDTTIAQGRMTVHSYQSKKNILVQWWNYYIIGNFKTKNE